MTNKNVNCPIEFIKWLDGKPIVTLHDFEKLTGIDLLALKPFFRREYFIAGSDWNGLGQGEKRAEFEKINDVHYEEETFIYLHASGFRKTLKILETIHPRIYHRVQRGIQSICHCEKVVIDNLLLSSFPVARAKTLIDA